MPPKKPGRPTHETDDTSDELHVLFGANLRQARLKAKLSQTELAARIGMRQPYLSDIENGVRDITLGTMTACAKAVGIDVRMLLKPPRKRK